MYEPESPYPYSWPDGAVASPGVYFGSDPDTGLYLISDGVLGVATAGVERIRIQSTQVVFNEGGLDTDVRMEGLNAVNLFNLNAGLDAIGINADAIDGSVLSITPGTVTRTAVTSVGNSIHIPADTIDFDNASNPTIAIYALHFLGIPTVTGPGASTLTFTDMATLYIQGPPVDSTNVTATNTVMALWIDAGLARLDGGAWFEDNAKTIFGTGLDAAIYYNNADLIIDPAEVGSGHLKVKDNDGTAFVRRILLSANDFSAGVSGATLTTIGAAGAIDAGDGRGVQPCWTFSASVLNDIHATIVMPEDWDHSGNINVRLIFAPVDAHTTGADFRFIINIIRTNDGADLTSSIASTEFKRNDGEVTVPTVAEEMQITSVTLASGSATFARGDVCRVGIGRRGNAGSDNRNGLAAIIGLEIQYDALR